MNSRREIIRVFDWDKEGETGWLELLDSLPPGTIALVEKVNGIAGQGAAASFTFGFNAGFIRGSLMGAKVPTHYVWPADWQASLKLPRLSQGKRTQHKRNLRDAATRLLPQHKWTLSTCDAALIAAHAVRVMP